MPTRRPTLIALAVLVLAAASCWGLSDPLPLVHCETGQKQCGDLSVACDDPSYGCASESCEPCAVDHGTATCAESLCAVGGCEDDFGDCNDSVADGCETSLVDNDEHCGMCGYDCLGASCECLDDECENRGCGFIQIASGQNMVWAVVASDTHVYWTNDDPIAGVWRTSVESTDPADAEIFAQVDGSIPRGIAIDLTHLYWVSNAPGAVHRAALGGTPPVPSEILNGDTNGTIGGPRHAAGIAIDAERVYWTDRGDDQADPVQHPGVWSVDKAGTEIPVQVANMEGTGGYEPNLIAVEPAGPRIYWTTLDRGRVWRADKLAQGQTDDLHHCRGSDDGPGWGIALDAEQVYWRDDVFLRAAPKDPEAPCPESTELLSDRHTPRFMVLDGRCLFWMYNRGNSLYEGTRVVVSRTDGTEMTVVAIAPSGAHGIAVDDRWIYWTDWDNGATPPDGTPGAGLGGVYKVARPPMDCD